MLQSIRDLAQEYASRLRPDRSQRVWGFVLALLAEALLILVVLSMGWMNEQAKRKESRLVSVSIKASEDAKPDQSEAARPSPVQKSVPQLQQPQPPQIAAVQQAPSSPASPLPAIIPVPRDQMASFDLSKIPSQARPALPGKAMMGPANPGALAGDSKRVGTAPNGQPMYAAAWYREPYDDELRGYLSTADGPGWALIACRTVDDFRVDDCVGLDEYPSGSRIQHAVLAAAWQFRVRPPRVGGVSQVGDWVRIRIDYTQQRQP
ncbi:MAG: hypothetical protein ACKOPG_11050 [Novosphingobium sp.]